jgi:hypothetical protein
MRNYKKLLLLTLIILFSSCLEASETFINEIPDFTQSELGGLKGDQYCAPVAISNSIVWLSNRKINQIELIEKLGSADYMNTSLNAGTDVESVIYGVKKIAGEIFQTDVKVRYMGWRRYNDGTVNRTFVPDINLLNNFIDRNSAAWINVGWYKYDKHNNQYLRVGGHWVTLVGSKPGILIIHDPAPRAGKNFSNEYVNISIIETGFLTGKTKGLPVSAKGFYKLGSGMHMKLGADSAIIDGVVYLAL